MAITDEDLRNSMEQMSGRQAWPHQLGAIGEMRAARPVGSPVAGGTPAQRRLEMEQAQRQFEEQMKLQREQMAMQERLARMRAAPPQQKPPERDLRAEEAESIRSLVSRALTMGDKGEDFIYSQIMGYYDRFEDPRAALQQALNMFKGQAFTPEGEPRTIQKHPEQRASIQPILLGTRSDPHYSNLMEQMGPPILRPAENYPAFSDPSVFEDKYMSWLPSNPYRDTEMQEHAPFWAGSPAAPPPDEPGSGGSLLDRILTTTMPALSTLRRSRGM